MAHTFLKMVYSPKIPKHIISSGKNWVDKLKPAIVPTNSEKNIMNIANEYHLR